MNKINKAVFASLLFVAFSFVAKAQDYTLDLGDTTTYSETCGKTTPSWWTIKNDSCILNTPYVLIESESGANITYTFRVNQSGNLEVDDNAYIQYQVDGGEWITDTMLCGGGSPAVTTITGSFSMNYGHYIRFRVAAQTNDKTEFWSIGDANLEITDNDDSQQLIVFSNGKPLDPPDTDPFFELPIELIAFSGKVDKGVVELKWSTAAEINNDFFTIEKSEDGVFFEILGFVNGAGNTNNVTSYNLSDDNPLKLAYYRLKQTDYDGAFTYSSIIKVSEELCGTNEIEIASSNGAIIVMANSTSSGKLDVNIYTVSGTLVFSKSHQIESGCSTINLSPEIFGNSIYLVNASLNEQKLVSTKVYY